MKNPITELSVTTTRDAADIVALIMAELGSEGARIIDAADILGAAGWDYRDDSLNDDGGDTVTVIGYFEDAGAVKQLKKRLKNLPVFKVTAAKIETNNWDTEWRKHYAPIPIGKLIIVPAWITEYDKSLTPVFVEPGQAFGTGSHESTALCIELLGNCDLGGKTTLDLGCGSGILGLCAVALGAAKADLTDIDTDALKVAEHNTVLNNAQSKIHIYSGDLKISGKYGCITANLTADLLLRALGTIAQAAEPDCDIIIGGIILSRLNEVKEAFSRRFKLAAELTQGEWGSLKYKL